MRHWLSEIIAGYWPCYPDIYLLLCLSVCCCVFLSAFCLPVCVSFRLLLCLSVCLRVFLSVFLSGLAVCLSAYLSSSFWRLAFHFSDVSIVFLCRNWSSLWKKERTVHPKQKGDGWILWFASFPEERTPWRRHKTERRRPAYSPRNSPQGNVCPIGCRHVCVVGSQSGHLNFPIQYLFGSLVDISGT